MKVGKSAVSPNGYRTIPLLCVIYKQLERLIYHRISHRIFEQILLQQAGFRSKTKCVDQVISLTTPIEAGFQRKLKTAAALIDLSATYDTLWGEGMVYKFLRMTELSKISSA